MPSCSVAVCYQPPATTIHVRPHLGLSYACQGLIVRRMFRIQVQAYLTQKVYKVVLQKSISVPIRQLILFIIRNEGYADGFVRELTFEERVCKHFL